MKRNKRFCQNGLWFAAVAAAALVSGCSNQNDPAAASGNETKTEMDSQSVGSQGEKPADKPFYAGMAMSQTPDLSQLLQGSLDLKDFRDRWVYYDEYDCYGLEYVVYCENPADPVKECMNIYVPAAYMNADGTKIGRAHV